MQFALDRSGWSFEWWRRLSAVYVSAGKDAPAVLICHGIGELVEYWGGVQDLLKGMGVSSLVFNYSGYGESTGRVSAAHCEEDAMAAYKELVDRGHAIDCSAWVFAGERESVVRWLRASIWMGWFCAKDFHRLREAGEGDGVSAMDDACRAGCVGHRSIEWAN